MKKVCLLLGLSLTVLAWDASAQTATTTSRIGLKTDTAKVKPVTKLKPFKPGNKSTGTGTTIGTGTLPATTRKADSGAIAPAKNDTTGSAGGTSTKPATENISGSKNTAPKP